MKRLIPLITFLLLLFSIVPVAAQTPVVRAVLFYSPFCGHCHKVINEYIPPLSQQYNQEVLWTHVAEEAGQETSDIPPLVALEGDMLQILFVNTTTPLGGELFAKAIEVFEIPDPVGVPALIVGDQYMIGSVDIPAQFPGIIADSLASGGLDWPEIPDLTALIAQLEPYEEAAEASTAPEAVDPEQAQPQAEQPVTEDPQPEIAPELINVNPESLSVRDRVLLDPVGNTISIMLLIGMTLSVIGVAARWGTNRQQISLTGLHWSLMVLVLVGMGVAAYLTFIESTGTEAICGPVGDCNRVQDSPYALLFGIIPIGVFGLIGYFGLLVAWTLTRINRQRVADIGKIGFFILALLGTIISIYLTFLEPFVIGATCMWCLTSAVIMTALMILSTDPARTAFLEQPTNGPDFAQT